MENEQGEKVDLYIPRKCSSSSRIINAMDHSSIQIEFVACDPQTGRMTNDPPKRYAICGALRHMGEADDCLNRLAQKDNMLDKK